LEETSEGIEEYRLGRRFELNATVVYTDQSEDEFFASYNPKISEWQYASFPVKIDKTKQLYKIVLSVDYSYNNGDAKFKELSIRNGKFSYDEYDDEKYLI
jgi:hypothetical protein